MKKNNKVLLVIICIFILLIIIISSIFIYKKLTYHEEILSIDDVIDINNKIKSDEKVDMKYFKDFKVIDEKEENGITTYTYDMGSKYYFEVSTVGDDQIVSMTLVNKVTYEYVNILQDSLDEFLQFD